MSPAHETQSMREIRLLRGRLPRKGGGLTGMRLTCTFQSECMDQILFALNHRDGPRTVDIFLERIADIAFSVWTIGNWDI
jgi:hypothetical protein